jgi:hypothetical protein
VKAIRRMGDQAGTWLGIGACVAGFVLIALGWAQVNDAGRVEDQVGPLVGLGLGGLGLIAVGVAVVGVVARRQDGARAARQADELADVLRQLGGAVDDLEARLGVAPTRPTAPARRTRKAPGP